MFRLVLLLAAAICFFSSWGNAFVVPRPSNTFALTTSLEAKKKKKKKRSQAGQGFSKAAPLPEPVVQSTEPSSTEQPADEDLGVGMPLQSIESGGSDAIPTMMETPATPAAETTATTPSSGLDSSLPPEERAKTLLREKYGLRTREEQDRADKKQKKRKEAQKRQQELQKMADADQDVDLLAQIPAPLLIAIDRFLKIGVAVCTVAFVAAGLAITAEAWANASGNPLPPDVDEFITQVVEPNFTPGLGVLLAFSVSLGIFAAAQLGSDSSQYKED